MIFFSSRSVPARSLCIAHQLQAYGNAFHYMESLLQANMEVGDENLTDATTDTTSATRQSLPSTAATTINVAQPSAQTLLANAFANYSALSITSTKPIPLKSRKFDVTQVCTCGRKFSYENLYAYHKRWECGQELTCRFCLRSYCSVYYVKRHMKTCKKRVVMGVGMGTMVQGGHHASMSGPPRSERPDASHNMTL